MRREPYPPHVFPSFCAVQHEQNLLFYFVRHPGADVTEETFTTAVQFGNARGDAPNRLLTDMTWLHAPAVALTPFRDKSIKDNYHYHMHGLLAFFTGQRNSTEAVIFGNEVKVRPVVSLSALMSSSFSLVG